MNNLSKSGFLKSISLVVILTTNFLLIPKSQAAVINLNFEGINNSSSPDDTSINNFYNGGTSSAGTSGINYGVTFSSNAEVRCLNTLSNSCNNSSRGGLGDLNSQTGALVFLTGSQTYINYTSGFNTGFSFNYSAPFYSGNINVYDSLNGTGNVLATLNLPITNDGKVSGCVGYNANYCPFMSTGVSFAGTAKSIGFGGTANYIVFDDVTIGSATPGVPTAVPEPFTIVGTLIGGTAAFRMRKKLKAIAD